MKIAVVTGASSGIGLGTAKVLIEKNWRVFGSVRKEGRYPGDGGAGTQFYATVL